MLNSSIKTNWLCMAVNMVHNKIKIKFLAYLLFFLLSTYVSTSLYASIEIAGYWKMDESSGTAVSDCCSNNNGTATDITWTDDQVHGYCGYFNGSSSLISISDDDFDMGQSDFTLSAWIKCDASAKGRRIISKLQWNGTAYSGYDLSVSSTGQLGAIVGDGNVHWNYYSTTGEDLTDSAWHHVAMVVSRKQTTTLKLYVDGVLERTAGIQTTGDISNAQTLTIGRQSAGAASFFPGYIEEVGVWKHALSDIEIEDIFECGDVGQSIVYNISDDFSNGLGKWDTPSPSWAWQIVNGELTNNTLYSANIPFLEEEIGEFELSFKLKLILENEETGFAGVSIDRGSGKTWSIRFSNGGYTDVSYTEDSVTYFWKRLHIDLPMQTWVNVKVKCEAAELTLTVDGTEYPIGTAPGEGGFKFISYRLGCAFDDINMIYMKENTQYSMNLLSNPGFEITSNPDRPDGWSAQYEWGYGLEDETWHSDEDYADFHDLFKIYNDSPHTGKNYLKIQYPLTLMSFGSPLTVTGNSYVFSAYMKASPSGGQVRMGCLAGDKSVDQFTTFNVSAAWTRYTFVLDPLTVPAHPYRHFYIAPASGVTVSVDSTQLEAGTTVGPFIDGSPMDAILKLQVDPQITNDDFLDLTLTAWSDAIPAALVRAENAPKFFTEHDYNTLSENSITFCYLNTISGGSSEDVEIKVFDPADPDTILASQQYTCDTSEDSFMFDLSLSALSAGEYQANLYLVSTSELLDTCTVDRRANAPKTEVRNNRLTQMIEVDKEPFFPFGPLFTLWRGSETVNFMKDSGFNCIIIGNKYSTEAEERAILQECDNIGLYVMEARYMNYSASNAITQATTWATITKDYYSTLGHYYVDEPAVGVNEEYIEPVVDCVKGLDPYRLSFINYNFQGLKQRVAGCPGNVTCVDRYASSEVYSTEPVCDLLKAESDFFRRPAFLIAQSASLYRDITPAELEFTAYTAIIRGIRGIFYWDGVPQSEATWTRMKSLAGEVSFLTDYLASEELDPAITVTPSDGKIIVLAKKLDDQILIIALNRFLQPAQNVQIQIQSLIGQNKTAAVEFESRNEAVANGVITDDFNGFERHVYLIDL